MAEVMQGVPWGDMLRVLVAAVLGAIIGFERESSHHEAGLRTNTLIAIGACLFTVLSINAFPVESPAGRDTARVAAQIVSGVGFIGAGVTLRREDTVKGLTTAATVWLVAAIGMAVGAGQAVLATFTTVLAFVVLRFLRVASTRISK